MERYRFLYGQSIGVRKSLTHREQKNKIAGVARCFLIFQEIKIAGLPAASYFLLLRLKESNQRQRSCSVGSHAQHVMPELKGDPGLPPLCGSLNQPQASGAAQLDLVGHTPHCGTRTKHVGFDIT